MISDMRRGDDQTAGAGFLEEMRSLGFKQPVIFYNWKARFGSMGVGDARQLRLLEDENRD